eukprot:scaffold43653_cov19-Tisochrysis_lutea.AAC.3
MGMQRYGAATYLNLLISDRNAVKHVCNRDRMFQARHQLQHIDRSCLNDAFVRSKGHQFSTRMLTSECMAWKKGCTWYPPNSISGMNPCKLSNHANYQCKLFTPRGHLSIDLFGNFRRGGVPSVPQILQVTHGWSCWPTKEGLMKGTSHSSLSKEIPNQAFKGTGLDHGKDGCSHQRLHKKDPKTVTLDALAVAVKDAACEVIHATCEY